MQRLEPFRSGAFRFACLLALSFAASAALLLVVVERSVSHYAATATEGGLKSEAAILQAEDREHGPANLVKAIDLHRRAGGREGFRYRLTDNGGRMLVDDFGGKAIKPGWGNIAVRESATDARSEIFKCLGVPTADGGLLVVATDTYDIQELRTKLDRFTIWAGIGITLFALVGGYVTGNLFMRRLDRVNAAIGRVRGGNVAERLPMIGISPEFDLLSSNLNAMLDQIGALMNGLRQVTTDIAHDLRTPLTRLRHQLEATRDSGRGSASVQYYDAGIDSAIAQTDEILTIFRALLRIGTIEGGDGRQHFQTIDLSEVVTRVIAAHQPVAEDAGKVLSCAIAPGLRVAGDGELLAQMIVNLIDNAIRHTPLGSRLDCTLERIDGRTVIGITDDGPGIPADEHAHVLTRFYRLDRSRNLPGAGLGMAMAAAIAALHQVRMELFDNRPGLRICLTFPDRPSPEIQSKS